MMSATAADRRINWLHPEIQSLRHNPHRGQSGDYRRFQLVLRYARSTYGGPLSSPKSKVIITRIGHGKESRPR